MNLFGNTFFIKLIPVFICLNFSIQAQEPIINDLVKGQWFVEGNLNDSIVKLMRKRIFSNPYRVFTFVKAGVVHRCDSVYNTEFDENGNEKLTAKLDCNSPATFGVKNMMLMISTGQSTHYFLIDPKKTGGYTLKQSKAEYYYQEIKN